MTFEEMLKLWGTIESLPELEAKLALFGLTIQQLERAGETLDDFDKVIEHIKTGQVKGAR